MGTLLGRVNEEGRVEVRDSYSVPHTESAEGNVHMDLKHHAAMAELHGGVARQERVVGWYSTGAALTSNDQIIQDFYNGEVEDGGTGLEFAIRMLVDVRMAVPGKGLGVRCFMFRSMTLQGQRLAAAYHEMPVELLGLAAVGLDKGARGRTGLDVISQASPAELPDGSDPLLAGRKLESEFEGLQRTLVLLTDKVRSARRLVDDVCAGRRAPDAEVGALIAEAVASVPKVDTEAFDKMFHEGLQDVLMVLYLTTLTQAQVNLAEKINALQRVKAV